MVAGQPPQVEQERGKASNHWHRDRDRCTAERVGCILQLCPHCRLLGRKTLHINTQEMLAALYGIRSFARDVSNSHILLLSDNITVVAYVNHLGGTRSSLRHRKRTLAVVSGPGNDDLGPTPTRIGDCPCGFCVQTSLRQNGLETVPPDLQPAELALGTIDPRPLCNQVDKTVYSWRPDPESARTDALIQDWRDSVAFAHPPRCLIGRILQKI